MPNKLSEGKWPFLFGAVRRRDWQSAAAQSQRKIVNDPVKNKVLEPSTI